MTFQELKNLINNNITSNNPNKISGEMLNHILNAVVTTIEENIANIEPEVPVCPEIPICPEPVNTLKYYCFYGHETDHDTFKRVLQSGITAKYIDQLSGTQVMPPCVMSDELELLPSMCCLSTDPVYKSEGNYHTIYDLIATPSDKLDTYEITEDEYYAEAQPLVITEATSSDTLKSIFLKFSSAPMSIAKPEHFNYSSITINQNLLNNPSIQLTTNASTLQKELHINNYKIVQMGDDYYTLVEGSPLKYSTYVSSTMPGYNYTEYPNKGSEEEPYIFNDGYMEVQLRPTSELWGMAKIKVIFPGLPDDNGKNLLGTTEYSYRIDTSNNTLTIHDVLQGVWGEFYKEGQYANIVFNIVKNGTQLELVNSEIVAKVYGNVCIYGDNSPLIGQ